MAENIVAGLFGLNPNEIGQQNYQNDREQAFQYAKLDPFEKANASIYQGAAGLARVGAGMMGMADPREVEAKQNQALQTQIDHSTPEGLLQGAAIFNQAGNPKMAFMYTQAAQKRKSEMIADEKEQAQAQYYSRGGARGQAANLMAQLPAKQAIARQNALKIGVAQNLTGQDLERFVIDEVRKVTETWIKTVKNVEMQQNPDGVQQSPDGQLPIEASSYYAETNPDSPVFESAVDMERLKAEAKEGEKFTETTDAYGNPILSRMKDAIGKTPAQYSPIVKADTESAKAVGKATGEKNEADFVLAKESRDNLYKIGELESQLKSSDAITGLGSDIFRGINRAVALLGGKDAAKTASDTEILDVMMGSEVFPLIQSLGIGARGMDTPAEREYMRSVLTGAVQLNKQTLLKMAGLRKQAAENKIVEFNRRLNKGELDSFFEQSGRTKERIMLPAAGKFDLSTPAKVKEVQKFISELRKTDVREADKLLADFKSQLKKPKLTPEQAKAIAKERGLLNDE